ncbi:hypothetical protein CR513_52072, partial [Mucuna pruriens]
MANDLKDHDEAIKQLTYHLQRAQNCMTQSANKHRRDVYFEEGMGPPHQWSVARSVCPKLSTQYYGLFQILKRVSVVACKFKFTVFHVSLLKKVVGEHSIDSTLPTNLELDGPIIEPEKVLKSRSIASQPIVEATWEDMDTIQGQFPYFNLEDKVASIPGGIDRPNSDRPMKVYVRKNKRQIQFMYELECWGGMYDWQVWSRRVKINNSSNLSILTSSTRDRHSPSCSGLHPNLLATSHRPALLKLLYIDFLFGLLYCPSSTPASPGGKCKLNLESTSSTSLSDSASFSDLITDSNN